MDKIRRSIKTHKGHLTRTYDVCEKLLTHPTPDLEEVLATIKSLEAKWNNYEHTYNKLESEMLESASDEKEIDCIQNEYYSNYSQYQTHVCEMRKVAKALTVQVSASANVENSKTVSSTRPKLPSIQLPTFSGDLSEYESFIDQFEAQVGSRTDLEPVTKLQYLKSQLKGKPSDLIRGLSSTSANYQNALETLKESYGDEEKIKHHLLQRIINLENPKHTRGDLENFRINMVNLTQCLRNKHDYSCCEWVIASLFQHKLSNATIRQLYMKYECNYFSLKQLNEGLRDLISHMEVEKQNTLKPYRQSSQVYPGGKEKPVGTYYNADTENKHKASKSVKDKVEIKCRFCEGAHKDSQCQLYTNASDRIERLGELKLCFRCMGSHQIRNCKTVLQTCRRCQKGKHHTLLCKAFEKPSNVTNKDKPITEDTKDKTHPNNVGHVNVSSNTALKQSSRGALSTALAKLEGHDEDVRLFFDQGSQKTFITRSLVERASLTTKSTERMSLQGFMSQPKGDIYSIVKPVIKMGNRKKRVSAVVVDELPKVIVTRGLSEVSKHLSELGYNLADPVSNDTDTVGPVDLLIGADHFYDFISLRIVKREGVHLLQSPAGYIITGKIPDTYKGLTETESLPTTEAVVVMKVTNQIDPLEDTETKQDLPVHKLWDLDVIGIDPTQPLPEDETSYQEYINTVRYEEGQYWVRLPWKVNAPELPPNYHKALGQMHSSVKNLRAKGLVEKYNKILHEQLEAKFIEEVPETIPSCGSHYLPHHAVMKESVTTPLRIVFNCSSKADNDTPSLNECLMTGQNLTKRLGDMLLAFRTGTFAYSADISKAFLRIGLQEQDRDYTRFLWPSDPNLSCSPIKTYRFRSVLFGATSSPFLLQATLDYHFKHSTSPVKETLASNFYVDNLLGTTSDHKFLKTIYDEANKELELANMPLRQWATNNNELKESIEGDFPSYKVPQSNSVLGLQWDTLYDTLSLKPVKYTEVKHDGLTKRKLLSEHSKLFDPLGLFTPITIKGKILLQDAWKLKCDWDDALPCDINDQWMKLVVEYKQISGYMMPRVVVGEKDSCALHIFCDASTKAYGAAAYIVTEKGSSLLTSKARVTPIKNRTIPQLELTALLVGTKLGIYIHETLSNIDITSTYLWSDSEVALQWVRNDSSKIPYVKNRVAQIKENKIGFLFRHVKTIENPADLLSRGTTTNKLFGETMWFKGPDWLTNKNNWPEENPQIVSSVMPTMDKLEESGIYNPTCVIEVERFSTLGKLLRVTNYVFKFINNIFRRKNWFRQLKINNPTIYWVKEIQGQYYQDEIRSLQRLPIGKDKQAKLSKGTLSHDKNANPELSTKTLRDCKLIRQLGLFLDEEHILRSDGRIHNSSLKYDTKHPILLPKSHWFTELIIADAHDKTMHGGVAETLTNIRRTFWIPKIRQAIKAHIKKCIICTRYDARPTRYPGPPPLPEIRVQESKPFQVVGIDFTGAIQLKNKNDEGTPNPIKVYVCLFTCATTRAVHLELVPDMSAHAFLRAFRRFAGRRSCPRLIISDNGSNFKASEVFIKQYFSTPEVQQFFENRRCEWKFIPPRAPWQGGFYERMIGIVKRCLRKILHNKSITVDELQTILVEIETKVNNRPLTYITDSIREPDPLTPNHLLQGSLIEPIPPVISTEEIKDPDFILARHTNGRDMRLKFNHISKILNQWNRIWHDEYLTSLREHHYGGKTKAPSSELKIGQIVLVKADTARTSWPLGKIVEMLPDKAGTLRLVKVLCKGNVSLRTVDKLLPLELTETQQEELKELPKRNREKREAAIKARERLRKQLNPDE